MAFVKVGYESQAGRLCEASNSDLYYLRGSEGG